MSKWVSSLNSAQVIISLNVSSVQYHILLNGQPRGHIVPQRGLRQGDPVSPYLFIMCNEALIANIKKAERSNQFTGMKVARACPSISHLLFADDSFFFVRHRRKNVTLSLGFWRNMRWSRANWLIFINPRFNLDIRLSPLDRSWETS